MKPNDLTILTKDQWHLVQCMAQIKDTKPEVARLLLAALILWMNDSPLLNILTEHAVHLEKTCEDPSEPSNNGGRSTSTLARETDD